MRTFLIPALLFTFLTGNAQSGIFKYQWKANPKVHTVDKKFADEAAVFVEDDRFLEYAFEKDDLFFYRTMHRIIHINNDKGIESFNKIYLPFDEGGDMIDVRARTILPDGRVKEMDKSNIRDLKDEDGQYKIFALEGLTKGCEVEYYFILKKSPAYFGHEVLAARVPVIQARFELISPDHLVFETKTYNNLPEGKDSTYQEKRHSVILDNNLDGMEEEKYSMYQASLKRVAYKLSYNKAKNQLERLFTWNELAKRVHSVYNTIPEKDKKKIQDLLSVINLKEGAMAAEKIMAIEAYLKTNFVTREDLPNEDAEDLGKVIKSKMASHQAMSMIYLALFRAAGVDYQVVLVGDRNNYQLDRSFENWNCAKNFLIYFPSTQKYLAPTELEYRYPWIPPTWTATNGLFCVGTTIGNFTTAVAEMKRIRMEDYEHNFLNMEMNLRLDKDDALLVDVRQLYGGYAASNYRLPFVYYPADQQEKFLKEMVRFGTNSENILSYSFENKEMDQKDPYLPFVIKASVKSTTLIERAGPKLIIKIGEVIGQQAEMYEAKARQTNIELNYPHSLVRTIRLAIPEGYKVRNLDDLNFNTVYKDKETQTMGFTCGYQQSGNELTITVREDYRSVQYPVEQYDPFKKVINAAADFNKVVLVLEKI